ncbi:MAG: SDR family NAD(P)-dependent oxidoreductase [Acidobacteriia bacterium]|nr:SDR family NAD(P)-dependent oxidoreductase [Terriglobia bacterium]
MAQKLYEAMVLFPYPVIAVLQGDALGAGLLAAALCDLMVCNEDASYGYTDVRRRFYPTAAEAKLFSERFGEVQAQDLFYVSGIATGRQLRKKGWTCPIVAGTEVEAHAQRLAAALATKSQEGLRLLKQHLTRRLAGLVKELTGVEAAAAAVVEDEPGRVGREIVAAAGYIQMETPAEKVLLIKLGAGSQKVRGKELVAELGHIFVQAHQDAYYKAIVLVSEGTDFVPGCDAEEAVPDFQRLIVESEIPVVAALAGNARGAAWLTSQFCDGCVYSQTGVYSAAALGEDAVVEQTASAIFMHRLGRDAGKEILLSGAEYSGADLQRRTGALQVAEHDQVLAAALRVAEFWTRLPRATLVDWKKHSAATIEEKIRRLASAAGREEKEEKEETPDRLPVAPASIRLQSKVVTATAHAEGIVVVKLEDREAKNMFSEALVEGVKEAFAHIEQSPAYKVVVLTGYDSYFACGGTKESLLAIQAGKIKFTDNRIFQVALECKLPVIAAMQGHGIGAGWTLGMLADVVLLSEESRYVSPYMNYGFTPGAGASWVLAEKLGQDVARESLLTGQVYGGRELKERGVGVRVMLRAEVHGAAMALARQIARRRRSCLIGLKQQLNGYAHELLEETYRLELAMHEKTFVGRAETLKQIEENFYEEMEGVAAGAAPVHVEPEKPTVVERVVVSGTTRAESDVLGAVTASLKTLLANELQMRENDIDENVQFLDLGLDSIGGVTWVRKINEKYQTSIEATKVYSHPTLAQLSRYVKEEAEKQGNLSSAGAVSAEMPAGSAKSTPPPQQQQTGTGAETKLKAEKLTSRRSRRAARFSSAPSVAAPAAIPAIAVIGMAGQFPQARNLEEFWQNIAQGKNCITQVPAQRWDVNAHYQAGEAVAGKTNSQWMGALEEYDRFDPLFFNISPTEAESMDPQQRLFLQACWHSIEDAGYDARVLSGSKCGVFAGCAGGDYHQLSREHQLSAQGFTGSAMSILAARISYFLNLQGPCISIDTACSSSLVAIAHACDSLVSGSSDLALAGGVYVMAGPEMHIKSAQAGMLSPEGKCYTFDQRADGFVPGEGVGVVLLKRLAEAERDGDIIYGVIQGWGENQDGKTNGITAPNPESQTRLEQEVYDKYGIDPAQIQLIEAHGTGTKLGDPIEVEGLKKAFRKYTEAKEYCALGSVKSNIGHCLTAAGVAGLIKLLLALKHKQLPPTINFEQLNEHIELKGSPFYVNSRLREWELRGAGRRQAAVSAFGFSGTNAHVVVGEYVEPMAVKTPASIIAAGKAMLPLSARTGERLKQKARDLWEFIRREGASVDLLEMAYTLQVGREPMEERAGFLVSSVGELAEKLQAYIEDREEIEDFYQGQVRRGRESISIISQDAELREAMVNKWIGEKRLSRLLELWVKGLEMDWNKMYGEVRPRRTNLPVYPFAKERYWIEAGADRQDAVGGAVHPGRTAALQKTGSMLAAPVWQASEAEASAGGGTNPEHYLIICELPKVNTGKLESLLPHRHCLSLAAREQKNIAQRYSEHALACFERIQAILRSKPQGKVLVQIVVPNHGEQVLLAGLSGLLKTSALENPRLIGQLILVPPEITTEELARQLQAEKASGPAPLIRYEQGVRQVLRWQEVRAEPENPPMVFKDHGVYLITGGLGGLGLLFAREILEQTRQARVILTGRSAFTAEKQACLDGLTGDASRVSYRQLDLGDLEQVRQLITAVGDEYGQLNGILHSAGMTADNFIIKKTAAEFRQVLGPKVTGTYNLDQASRDVELDFFVLFSSIAGAMGNAGQADYASANGFMDQFAAYRNCQVAARQRHGRTRSINWGLWQDGKMGVDAASRELLQQTTGMQPLQTATGLEAFYRSLALHHNQTLVLEGIQAKITSYLQKAHIFEPPSSTETAAPYQYANATTEAAVSLEQLQQQLKMILASVLRLEASIIDLDQPFVEFGLDSFLGTEMVVAINKKYGTELSNLKLLDYPTVREFSRFLEQEIKRLPGYSAPPLAGPAVTEPIPATPYPVLNEKIPVSRTTISNEAHLDDKIAIVGMSGRYPKAHDLKEYWDILAGGRNCIDEVPPSRWDVDRFYDPDRSKKGKTNSKWLGALDDIDCFDPLFFRISPHEAEHMDPQHRLFLQESYKAFEDAGYSPNILSNRKCGVYLGISTNEYASLVSRNGISSAPVTSNSYAIAAARIAYYLNLKGPAISIDTACSSSLVAIHLAAQALLSGEIEMALAGGITFWLTPESYIAMSQAGMFSPEGQCKTFDDSADGIVNGEGVGAVVLKRLKDAQRDNDFIYGVILGSGINQDGKTNGITAPSVNSQIELERGIYTRYKIDPETISYIETHGTGTKLGDPIELEALATVFKEKASRKNFCALGSVKSNIGHTTSAAGVAGVQKVLLSMQHRTIVPTLNVTKENTRFDFKNSPFYISREKQAWDAAPGSLRRAAVSSFGFSGTNAHLVIEEYPAPDNQSVPPNENATCIVPLSAKTAEQLRQRAQDLLEFVRARQQYDHHGEGSPVSPKSLDLAAVAYTLQIGREAMEERLCFLVASADQLAEKLSAWVNGEKNIEGVYQGHVEPDYEGLMIIGRDDDMQEAIDKWIARKKLAKLSDLWVRGLNFDWSKLYGDLKPRRISLPTYPFARERYWINEVPFSEDFDDQLKVDRAMRSIEDIINSIGEDTIHTDHAVKALKLLV